MNIDLLSPTTYGIRIRLNMAYTLTPDKVLIHREIQEAYKNGVFSFAEIADFSVSFDGTWVLINLCGNITHSCPKALLSLWMIIGAGLRTAIERPRTSRTCSIGLKSGDILTPLVIEYPTMEVFTNQLSPVFLALSSIKMKFHTTEKSDIWCRDLVPVPLTCQSNYVEHMKVGMPDIGRY
ncbi:hypothetical protein TNCV_3992421 [Trichonephila clavipes]|uniref:Uncharacterized protein n=1 Tax=Trichonephila clavipes TaxID=2585209 RepID=A0A8X6T881_TRICX|nr:hypothetical protein TNCV_3992421 [Trichonephila clavipes]